jgi:3-oxoacyl-[acyl-carrier-protein] synthase II
VCFLDALRLIQRGEVDVVLAGGSEAPLLPIGFAALANMHALSRRNDDPTRASRPFDKDRDGFVYGEGAGVVVIETAEHALARGAKIMAEVMGAAMTADAFHLSAPDPTGRGARMAITRALQDAEVAPDEVGYIAAHGTGTALNDAMETRAIKGAFGEHAYKLAISSPKSMVGHTVGAAGVVNAFAAIGAIREGIIAPTINLDNPDLPELDLDYVPLVARKAKVDTAIINGFGFGGQNAVAVFRRFEA